MAEACSDQAPKQFYVVVFKLGGRVWNDYGWALSEAQMLFILRHRLKHPEKYKEYEPLRSISTNYFSYRMEDITEFQKDTKKINRIIASLEKEL